MSESLEKFIFQSNIFGNIAGDGRFMTRNGHLFLKIERPTYLLPLEVV